MTLRHILSNFFRNPRSKPIFQNLANTLVAPDSLLCSVVIGEQYSVSASQFCLYLDGTRLSAEWQTIIRNTDKWLTRPSSWQCRRWIILDDPVGILLRIRNRIILEPLAPPLFPCQPETWHYGQGGKAKRFFVAFVSLLTLSSHLSFWVGAGADNMRRDVTRTSN